MSELNLPDEFRKLEQAISTTHTTAGEIFSIRQLMQALSDARDETERLKEILIDIDVCFEMEHYNCQDCKDKVKEAIK